MSDIEQFKADLKTAYAKARDSGITCLTAAEIASEFADDADDAAAAEIWGLSDAEKQRQALRCPCGGSDDYCSCQNAPTRRTLRERFPATFGG